MVQIWKFLCLSDREFPEFFKTHPTFIFRSNLSASKNKKQNQRIYFYGLVQRSFSRKSMCQKSSCPLWHQVRKSRPSRSWRIVRLVGMTTSWQTPWTCSSTPLPLALAHIINLSLHRGMYPHLWKLAKIIHLHKNIREKTDQTKYCPIALLPVWALNRHL